VAHSYAPGGEATLALMRSVGTAKGQARSIVVPEHKRLAEAIEGYERWREAKGKARTTVQNEMYVLRRFALWYGDVQIRNMTPEKVASWFYGENGLRHQHRTRDGSEREPIAASTHNYYRSRLSGFFEYATRRGWVRTDLLEDVDPLRLPTRLRQRPTPDVLNAMVDVASGERDRALLSTLIHTGLRMNEAMRLRVGDVDLERQGLAVYISKSDLEDDLPITAPLGRELRRWMLAYSSQIGRPLRGDDHLFPARKTGGYQWRTDDDGTRVKSRAPDTWVANKPMTHSERVVKAALHALGLPTKGEGCHTLRRAAARAFFDSLTEEGGYDSALRVVSAWLHHKNSTTTERYLGLSVERKLRDEYLRGREFLTSRPGATVLPFQAAKRG